VTEIEEAVREGSPPENLPLTSQAESAQRAYSVPQGAPIVLQAVTDSAQAARRTLGSAVAALDRQGSLIDARPLSFREARAHHHRCAAHYEPLIAIPRLAWGYFHLLVVKPALNFLEWVTESPARFFVAVVVGVIIWFWS
jgi:hypothetical protein